MQWRLVLGAGDGAGIVPCRGAVNMAVDSALLETTTSTGRPTVRFYAWSPACLSLGRNQLARAIHDARSTAAVGIDVVRRPTGGLAVLHDRELTYAVVAPVALLGGPRAAYTAINRALVEGLRALGVAAFNAPPATRARASGRVPAHAGGGSSSADPPVSFEPCFLSPAPGEVLAAGRKLAGSAQRCERGFLLQHGSILVDSPTSLASELMPGSITLRDLLGAAPSIDDVAIAIRHGFEQTFGVRFVNDTLSLGERQRLPALTTTYDDDEWTWRR